MAAASDADGATRRRVYQARRHTAHAAIWALQAGKHVYVEKPVCHDMFSGRQMVAAARKHGRLAQGGTQRRSSRTVRRAVQALHEGVIGDLYMARCVHYQKRSALEVREAEDVPSTLNWDLWLGPAPKQAFRRNLQPYNWHWFWDFGNGELGNNGVHFIDIGLFGNISYRLNRGFRFDPGTQRFTGDEEANRMLRNKYRAPFTIPDRV